MIKKLKTRFIVLAMVSLAVLLAVIVAGMNIINYEKVVSDADARIEVLEENADRLLYMPGGEFMPREDGFLYDDMDDDRDPDDVFDMDEDDGPFFGRGGYRGPSMTRDEAEESRFFMVTAVQDGDVQQANVDRISSIDETEAVSYAKEALSSGKEEGFIGDFRYSVAQTGDGYRVTFLDCGRVLESFRNFLKYSVLMSLIGLLAVFFVILYFAGRIVRPVAESYEKQKRFITDAGHEIKTPLAIIKANIDLMDMELDSKRINRDDLRDSLGDINGQVDRLTGLTNDLVYLSRMEEADSSLVMTEVPLSEIVSETVSSFEPLAAEKGKEIRSVVEPMISVKGSTKELEKLLSIVLENAIKYSPAADCDAAENGSAGKGAGAAENSNVAKDADAKAEARPGTQPIEVSLKKEGRNAVLEIRNETESELTNEALSHVFERFYRTDSSRNSATGGHGIGLSMASAIVKAHGGKISARTTDGSDFIVTASIPMQ